MHFCNVCSNMYYIRIDAENTNKLIYYCRNCGNEDNLLTNENTTVSKTQLKKSEQSFSHIINKYIRYDDVNMKYVYLCSTCDTVWKTDEQK